ncbi:MAG: energy transducer TonB [Terracidiphilus sp.]|jgi:TonB family protein
MSTDFFRKSQFVMRHAAATLFQVAALALVVMMAMPARAADDRAIRNKVPPIYPELAKRMKISGTVNIEATVDAAGKVSDAKMIGGNKILAPAAEDAVRKWTFAPGSGTAKVDVDVNFSLGQ